MQPTAQRWSVALACGGTGGHLFPGLAVAEVLRQRDCAVLLLVSRKEIDGRAMPDGHPFEVAALDAVVFQPRRPLAFMRGLLRSHRDVRRRFLRVRPHAVLGMGGFTSAAPIWAGRQSGAATFLHESNSIPGRANRWLAPWVTTVFVGFPAAQPRLRCPRVLLTGTPVRSGFRGTQAAPARRALGLDPDRPVLLVTGGSQGASALNRLMIDALPNLTGDFPELQYVHLTGQRDLDLVRQAYGRHRARALVAAFQPQMEVALGAATLAISRAGASFLAELAAVRLPAILVPFPAAADNHQWHNARTFADSHAAVLFEQQAGAAELVTCVRRLLRDSPALDEMRAHLAGWDHPQAAETIASSILEQLPVGNAHSPQTIQPPRTAASGFAVSGSKGGP